MDSEVTDLAGIKSVTISTLQVKPSEGAFVNGDKTKLDGIEENTIAGVKTFSSTISGNITGNSSTATTATTATNVTVVMNPVILVVIYFLQLRQLETYHLKQEQI